MKGIKDFIIKHNNPYNETFSTEKGVHLYGDVNFTADRMSNRIVTAVGIPLYETEIKQGYELLIDFSNFYRQTYHGTKQWYKSVIDDKNNLYQITPNMIICYRENKDSEWVGFKENNIVLPVYEEEKIKTNLILPNNVTKKEFSGKVIMTYSNKKIKGEKVKNGDVVHINPLGGVKFWFDGIEYWWIRNKDIHGREL